MKLSVDGEILKVGDGGSWRFLFKVGTHVRPGDLVEVDVVLVPSSLWADDPRSRMTRWSAAINGPLVVASQLVT